MLHFLLWPFSFLYGIATAVRNHLYDAQIRSSFSFDKFILSVGNLSVGGTGKTPMTEYLIRLLHDRNIVTLSRGYGRKTKGYRVTGPQDSAKTVGDEPFQLYRKFPDIKVTVCEERAVGIPFILADFPETDVILLDDAFQHRPVKPQLSILLTTFERPFFRDHLLPAGRLREARKGAGRADIIVVTKCPEELGVRQRDDYREALAKYAPDAPVFFSHVRYSNASGDVIQQRPVVVFAGIANPKPFIQHVHQHYRVISERRFGDHHDFTQNELTQLLKQAKDNDATLLTTEKDYRRIDEELRRKLENEGSLQYIPIETVIENGREFDAMVKKAFNEFASGS